MTGAYLGTPLSFIAMGVYCWHRLRQHVREVEPRQAESLAVATPCHPSARATLSLWSARQGAPGPRSPG